MSRGAPALVMVLALALPAAPLVAAARDRGAALFGEHCAVCHQATGEGTPGFAPRIAGTLARHAGSDAGRAYLLQVVIDGLAGPIVVDGERFNGAMPGFPALNNDDVQALLGHLTGVLNAATAWPPDPAVIDAARKRRLSPNEVRRLRGS